MVAGALVVTWVVVSLVLAVVVGAGIHLADRNARRQQQMEPFRLP